MFATFRNRSITDTLHLNIMMYELPKLKMVIAKVEFSGFATTHIIINNFIEDLEKEFGKDAIEMVFEKKMMGGIIYFVETDRAILEKINKMLLTDYKIHLTFMSRK